MVEEILTNNLEKEELAQPETGVVLVDALSPKAKDDELVKTQDSLISKHTFEVSKKSNVRVRPNFQESRNKSVKKPQREKYR